MELLDALVALTVLVGAGWFGLRIEPHWVSRDGSRIICAAQLLDNRGQVASRWHEVRVTLGEGRIVLVEHRRMRRRPPAEWSVVREADAGRRGRIAFALQGRHDDAASLLVLRLPHSSRAVPLLRQRLTGACDGPPSPAAREQN